MDYERNNLYFFPTPAKIPYHRKFGRIPFVFIGIGIFLIMLMSGTSSSAGVILGLPIMAVGIVWIGIVVSSNAKNDTEAEEFNKNRTIVSDSEIDEAASSYLHNRLKSKALKKLGIDEDQCKEILPIQFDGYYYYELKTSEPEIKRGNDGRYRSSHYNKTMFFCSAEQIYCYQLRFSLLKDEEQEISREFFYRDIVDASTTSGTIGKGEDKVSFEEFTLITTGGTEMGASIFDEETAERSIQGMRSLLRSKKQQL